MKIIIAGAGEVGSHLAKLLSGENQDVIVVDNQQDKLDMLDSNYNLMTRMGSTSSIQMMRELGVSDCDLYIAVTPYETRNITSCGLAKRLGAHKTVARIDNFEFLRPENKQLLRSLGTDNLIYPEYLAANEIDIALQHNWARYWCELHGGQLLVIGVKMRKPSPLIDIKIKDLPVTDHNFHIAAIKRNHETIIPSGNDEICDNDIAYFVTTQEYIPLVRELSGKKKRNIHDVMIMSGSRTAVRFADQFSSKYHIKIIEPDLEHCQELATRLPDCDIEHGDALDIDVLRENNLHKYDAFMALSSTSESNILSCLTAKEFGVSKTVAQVENLQLLSQVENLNIGTAINKKLLTSGKIFQILLDLDIENAKCLALADAEVAELQVKNGAKITKAKVKDLHLPFGMTLAACVHDGVCSLVSGGTQIYGGDKIVLFCLNGFIHKIEKWFN